MRERLRTLGGWIGNPDRTTSVERRLRRERPRVDRRFAAGTRHSLGRRWAVLARPRRFGLLVTALLVAGLVLLLAALAVAES